MALLRTDAAHWMSGHTVMADGAASFAARGTLIAQTATLPPELQRQRAGLAPVDADTPPPSAAPSVPDL